MGTDVTRGLRHCQAFYVVYTTFMLYLLHMKSMDALILSLPAHHSTVRMRVWRTLKENGWGVLRDGVYVLPSGHARARTLTDLESSIRSAGGSAETVELTFKTDEQAAQARRLFDRAEQYGSLVQKIHAMGTSLPRLGARKALTALRRLERAFEKLAAIDFFPGQAKQQAFHALSHLKDIFEASYADGEPRPSPKRLRHLAPARYQKRVWATRKNLWVDRLAS